MIRFIAHVWRAIVFWGLRIVPVILIALVGIGAQSCQVEVPGNQPSLQFWTEWYRGWLDEGNYIYWTLYASAEVWVNVEFSGYRDRKAVRLWIYLIPAEDIDRWKSGKPVRYIDWVNSDGEGMDDPDGRNDGASRSINQVMISSYVSGGQYALIVRNEWILDFTSGDAYIVVRGAYR